MTDEPEKGFKTEPKIDEVQDAATKKLLEGLGNQVVQASYGQVAPGFDPSAKPGKGRDPYYIGPPDDKPQRAKYGPDGTLVPGGKPLSNGETVPDFREQHKTKEVDPTKPYARSDIGEQVRNGNKPQGPGRLYSWQGGDFFEPAVQGTIMMRGQHRDFMNSSLFAAAASIPTPLLHEFISKKANESVAKATENGVESRFGKWWQTNADPAKYSTTDLIKTDQKYVAAFQEFEGLQTKLATAANGEGDLAAKAAEKLEFLKTRTAEGNFESQSFMEASVKEGGKFFDADELKILEGRANAGKMIDAVASKQRNRMAQALENMPGWLSRAGTGVVSSAAQYGIVSADRSMTEKVAGKFGLHESWNASQFLGPMALAALPGKLKLAAPIFAIGGSQAIDGLARLTGLTAPDRVNAATGAYDGWNGASVAGSLTLATYAKDWRAKAIIAGVGTLAPVLVHAYQDNIGGNLKGAVENVRESFDYDHNKRSYSSLREIDSSMQQVLNKKEGFILNSVDASFAAMNDRWKLPVAAGGLTTEQKLLGLRDDASATGPLSRSFLDKGTLISEKDAKPEYMLDGYQLDVGGRSLHYMLRTRNSADKAASLTEQIIRDNADPSKQVTIKGELPKQSEADDLRKYSAEAQTDITKILDGKHDIRGAYEELVKKAEVLDKVFLNSYINEPDKRILYYNDKAAKAQAAAQKAATEGNEPLRQEAELKTQEYAKVVAKLYRDQALVYMAMATAKMKNGNDGGGAYGLLIDDGTNHNNTFLYDSVTKLGGQKKGYNGAQGTLRIADSYSPGNPDTQQLSEIFTEVASEMQAKRKLQLISGSSNLLGFRDQFARPGP